MSLFSTIVTFNSMHFGSSSCFRYKVVWVDNLVFQNTYTWKHILICNLLDTCVLFTEKQTAPLHCAQNFVSEILKQNMGTITAERELNGQRERNQLLVQELELSCTKYSVFPFLVHGYSSVCNKGRKPRTSSRFRYESIFTELQFYRDFYSNLRKAQREVVDNVNFALKAYSLYFFLSPLRTFRFQGFPRKQVSKEISHLGTSLKLSRDLLSYHLAVGLPPESFPLSPASLIPP